MCSQGIFVARDRGLTPVVQKVDGIIYWINHYPLDSAIGFPNTYPSFEQPEPLQDTTYLMSLIDA